MQFEFYLNELHDEVLEIFFAIEIRAGFNDANNHIPFAMEHSSVRPHSD